MLLSENSVDSAKDRGHDVGGDLARWGRGLDCDRSRSGWGRKGWGRKGCGRRIRDAVAETADFRPQVGNAFRECEKTGYREQEDGEAKDSDNAGKERRHTIRPG